jgi:hypothetical protein
MPQPAGPADLPNLTPWSTVRSCPEDARDLLDEGRDIIAGTERPAGSLSAANAGDNYPSISVLEPGSQDGTDRIRFSTSLFDYSPAQSHLSCNSTTDELAQAVTFRMPSG